MPDYQKLYLQLFNAVTDAIAAIDHTDYGTAKELLIKAQQDAEDAYSADECPWAQKIAEEKNVPLGDFLFRFVPVN